MYLIIIGGMYISFPILESDKIYRLIDLNDEQAQFGLV